MSKAFVKESEGSLDDELLEDQDSALPSGSKNYITPEGAQNLKSELKKLLYEDRPEVVKTVSWAASNGDRSENGDYIYGKKRLREIDRRIRFLTKRLDASEIIDPTSQSSEKILFGATVTIENEEGEVKVYKIVGIDETNVEEGKISWISPIGKALLNAEKGDQVTLKTPKGEQELEIIKIEYKKI